MIYSGVGVCCKPGMGNFIFQSPVQKGSGLKGSFRAELRI